MAPIQDLSAPKGWSTVQRRVRITSGSCSIRSIASSMGCSCSHPLPGRRLQNNPPRGGDAALFTRRAAGFSWAPLAFVLPISPVHQTAFFARAAICEFLASGTHVDIGFGVIGEVSLHKHALLAVARRLWSRNSDRDLSWTPALTLNWRSRICRKPLMLSERLCEPIPEERVNTGPQLDISIGLAFLAAVGWNAIQRFVNE